MRIAFFHELHFGGARRVVLEFAREFGKYHEVTSYYTSKEREKDLEGLFAKTYFFQFSHVNYLGKNWKKKLYKDLFEPLKLYFLHKKIAKEIESEGYDFVLVHLSRFTHAPFLLRFLKTPAFYLCHEPLRIAHDPVVGLPKELNFFKSNYERIVRTFRKIIDRSNAKKARLIITNSEYSAKNIKAAYGKNAEVAYLGVNHKIFKPIKIKKKYDLIFVGEDVWIEGYDLLTQVSRLFKNTLKIRVVKSENGKHISDSQLAEEYNKSKICVVFGRFDPFTMIPLEAMACSVPPILVNEGGGIEAIVNNKSGFLVKRNAKEAYTLIRCLLKNKKLRDKVDKEGRKSVLSFWNWEESYKRIMKIIDKQLSK